MLARITGNRIILFAVIGVVAGLLLSVVFLVVLKPSGTPTPTAEQVKAGAKVATPAKAAAAKTTGSEGASALKFGDTYEVKDKIVNLADPGGRRYLRFSVAIEFAPVEETKAAVRGAGYQQVSYTPGEDAGYQPATAGEKDTQKAFETRIKKYIPAIEDIVTVVLSSKTSAEVLSTDGKEQARKEILDRLNRLLQGTDPPEHVTNVYFTDFVVQ